MSYCPLDLVENYLKRFVAYPSEHALVAHTLWIAHTHLMDCWDTTPRLAFMSAEKASGKSRALEVTALFVPDPILSISASPAVIVRIISDRRPTILYDEIDAVFGNAKREDANADLRSVLNGGYRRGAKVHRCTPKKFDLQELDAFAAVAVAGLRDLPDTLASRSIFIRMQRRAPNERVEGFRQRYHSDEAGPIREDLAEWCATRHLIGAEPELPPGIEDRAADCWEPLLAVADAAGSDWPKRARDAAIYLTGRTAEETLTSGVELLSHVRDAFGGEEKLWTAGLIERLVERDESPWKDLRGRQLDDRGLAKRLKPYGIKSKDVRISDKAKKGYYASDFHDAWERYLPKRDKGDKGDIFDNQTNFVADVADVAANYQRSAEIIPFDGDPFASLKDPSYKLKAG